MDRLIPDLFFRVRMMQLAKKTVRVSTRLISSSMISDLGIDGTDIDQKSLPKKRQIPEMSTTQNKGKKRGRKIEELPAITDFASNHSQIDQPEPEVSPSSSFESDAKTKDGRPWNFKISSWNVSGIRAWVQKKGLVFVTRENPDILVLQEVKCSEEKLPQELKTIPGYHSYWCSHQSKRGYSGVGILTKKEPINVKYGLGIEKHDHEGRLITAEYDNFYLAGVYSPNSGDGLKRLPYRQEWNADLLAYLKRLDAVKPVICAGDLNVAHHPIDLARPKDNEGMASFTLEERGDFSTLLNSGFIDSFRCLYPDKAEAYTFWSYRTKARERNVGWRLDYFVLSERLAENLCDSVMRTKVLGSDHCPLTLFMAL